MSLQKLLTLTEQEKTDILQSISLISDKLNVLVEQFYSYFIEESPEIKRLFQNIDLTKQFNMFNISIGVIISNISNPMLIQDHLDQIIAKHSFYGVQPNHVEHFNNAFTKAMMDVYSNNKEIVKLWLKVIHSVMLYFKNKIS